MTKQLANDGTTVRPDPVVDDVEPIAPDPEPDVEPARAVAVDGFADEVATLSVDDVMDRVEAGEWDPAEVYVAEEDGKARKTLLMALESFAANQ